MPSSAVDDVSSLSYANQVLGGTSFIGRWFVEKLHERGDEVLVVHQGIMNPARGGYWCNIVTLTGMICRRLPVILTSSTPKSSLTHSR